MNVIERVYNVSFTVQTTCSVEAGRFQPQPAHFKSAETREDTHTELLFCMQQAGAVLV